MSKLSIDSMATTIDKEIARLQRCRGWMGRVDDDVMRAGRKVFASDIEFARWLASPQQEFQGRIPIELMVSRWDKGLVTGTLLLMSDQRERQMRTPRTKVRQTKARSRKSAV